MSIVLLGLDPGLRKCGWGVIAQNGNALRFIACGAVTPKDTLPMAERLAALYAGLVEVIKTHQPAEAGVEETFVNANPASALKLGQARGVVLLTPALAGLPVFEYAATLVKKSVVGTGHADKAQIRMMVERLLPKAQIASEDAADALAVAICHAHHRKSLALTAQGAKAK